MGNAGGDSRRGDSSNDLSGSSRDVVQAGSVEGGIHFHHDGPGHAGTARPTPKQLPGDIASFVNRSDELGQLNAVLPGREGGPLVVRVHVIAGTAGGGKTSLALHWAHQVKDRFPDGQLYVNLSHTPRRPPYPPPRAPRDASAPPNPADATQEPAQGPTPSR